MLPIINFDNPNSIMPCELLRTSKRNANKASNQWLMCSQQSILSAMNRFVKSVNNMDSTVLVPSKLRDMEVVSLRPQRHIPSPLNNTDLHSFYQMLNDVKKELLWGQGSGSQSTSQQFVLGNGIINRANSLASSRAIKHSCQSSEDSLGSLGSSASSSVSDTESDADSMITDRDSIDDHTSHLAVAFRHHLHGLNTILHQLADSADYLSYRYQEELEDL